MFHAHPEPAVTLNDPLPPPVPMLALPGENAYVQPPAADSRKFATVTAFPLCTRTLSAVVVVPSGSGGLPYVRFGFER